MLKIVLKIVIQIKIQMKCNKMVLIFNYLLHESNYVLKNYCLPKICNAHRNPAFIMFNVLL